MEHRIAKTEKGPIEFTWLGNGPVILVCHGTSCDCFSHDGYDPLLQAGFSILTPSRPGYGRTLSRVGPSAKEAAEAMVALLNALEIRKCALMAISGGGPTGIALAANSPQRIDRLALIAAVSRPEDRANEPGFKSQVAFYGPLHNLTWSMLQLMSHLSPQMMAKQTMAIFSTHDPHEAYSQLKAEDIHRICHFYRHRSARRGALNDLAHTVGDAVLQSIKVPTLVIHSREDKSVPFRHAEYSLALIPHAELCEGGFTGHFFWIGPDYPRISQRLLEFLRTKAEQT